MVEEFSLIERYFAPLTRQATGAFNLTDDAAVIPPVSQGHEWVITKDALVEGVHFLLDSSPRHIARKMMGVNLSDIASMGARPRYYMISAAINAQVTEAWLADFSDELRAIQDEYGVVLLGGDTVSHKEALSLSVTMLGEVSVGKAVRRKGACVGDRIYVTGTLGDAALGLSVLQENTLDFQKYPFLVDRYWIPRPRTKLCDVVQEHVVAATDISDGLLADIQHICNVSGVGADVVYSCIPLSEEAQEYIELYPEAWQSVVGGGDDYELIMAVPKVNVDRFESACAALTPTILVTEIGTFVEGNSVRLLDDNNQSMQVSSLGYVHT